MRSTLEAASEINHNFRLSQTLAAWHTWYDMAQAAKLHQHNSSVSGHRPQADLARHIQADGLARLITLIGSTTQPKATALMHDALVPHVNSTLRVA